MRRSLSLCRGAFALGLVFLVSAANAETIQNLATSGVATTYTYPSGGDPGILTLDDNGLGLIALFADDSELDFGSTSISLTLELTSDNSAGGIANGSFGPGESIGTLMIVDDSGMPATLFQADVTAFQLIENDFAPGVFTGSGTFANAVYGGGLDGVTLPTDGDLVTSLISWYLDPALTDKIDIDDFSSPFEGTAGTIFGESTDVNIFPEPATVALLALAVAIGGRRRN